MERLEREAAPEVTQRLKTAALLLAGLRFQREQLLAIFQGVRGMRESAAYDVILDEGRLEGRLETLHQQILRQGPRKLGEPDEAVRRSVLAVNDLDRLWRMSDRLPDASTWDELLGTP